jgi:hypothetical protein
MRESRRQSLDAALEPNALVARLPEAHELAIALGIGIALMGIAGLIVGTDTYQGEGSLADRMFNLANEKTVPTFFSGAILFAGGLCSLLAGRVRVYGTSGWWIAFGAFLIFMSADEVVQIHEKVETWTGVDWEQPYAVVALGAAVVWFNLVRRMDNQLRLFMVCGAIGWMISFVLEDAEYNSLDHRVSGFTAMNTVEELAEMAGSSLWLIAIVIALKRHQPRAA